MRASFIWAIVMLASLGGCTAQVVDAVNRVPCGPNGSEGACASESTSSLPPGSATAGTTFVNSDPWLSQHHDELRAIAPRVLVVDFYNGIDVDSMRAVAERQIAALAEGSRYHAYSDSSAPPFLQYQLVGMVDLTDHPVPNGWPYDSSTQLPTRSDGSFDLSALFDSGFASNYGFADPNQPGGYLGLCSLFERGIVNEVWLAVTDPPREPPSMVECKQVYDASESHVSGSFVGTADGSEACSVASACQVTVRLAHLSATRGPGCDLMVRGWSIEDAYRAIPYLADNEPHFINRDFRARFGAPFDSLEDICTPSAQCVSYPSPTVAADPNGAWEIKPYDQGCGSTSYPANARQTWDFTNRQTVQSHCEHYGMQDGPNNQDAADLYTSDKITTYADQFPDCGGGWQIYWRQSIPGLDNIAYGADGLRMKNWWPFLFY